MRSKLSPPSDPLKPRISSAIIFAGNAVVFLVLSLLTQRMIYSFLFAVTFLLSVYEIVALWKQKRAQRGLHRRDYSDAEYRSLGMTRPQKDRRGAVQSAINVLLSLATGAITLCDFTTNDPALSPLLGAAMPFILILFDYNTVRFTWQEIRGQTTDFATLFRSASRLPIATRICQSDWYPACTGLSIPGFRFPYVSPQFCHTAVQESPPVVHRLRLSSSP